jgi:hypothetical protein
LSSNDDCLISNLSIVAEDSCARREAAWYVRTILVFGWVGSVLLVLFLSGSFLRWATYRFDFTEPKLIESLNFQGETFDILYFGDSLTLEGVNAKQIDGAMGTRSYNMALGGASELESELQLRHFIEYNP